MNRASYSLFVVLMFTTLLTGCATERSVSPNINVPSRTALIVSPAILGAVYDGRTSPESKDVVSVLQSDLSRIYGSSIEWTDYFAKSTIGRVTVRLRIVTLGSTFGSRLVSSAAFANAIGTAQVSATGPWGSMVGNVSSQQSILAGSFSGEGWWNGAAWIDLEVQDYRSPKPIAFTLPIVAEHRESNLWGYASGDRAAKVAWERVSAQLTRAIDAIARTVRDQQP